MNINDSWPDISCTSTTQSMSTLPYLPNSHLTLNWISHASTTSSISSLYCCYLCLLPQHRGLPRLLNPSQQYHLPSPPKSAAQVPPLLILNWSSTSHMAALPLSIPFMIHCSSSSSILLSASPSISIEADNPVAKNATTQPRTGHQPCATTTLVLLRCPGVVEHSSDRTPVTMVLPYYMKHIPTPYQVLFCRLWLKFIYYCIYGCF